MREAYSIGPDDPVPLHRAVALFFPAGGVTLQSLRTEIRKGNLVPERIAGYVGMSEKMVRDNYGHHSSDYLQEARDAI